MRTPSRPLPETVTQWTRWAAWLRWADALAAWILLWIVVASAFEWRSPTQPAVVALALLAGLAFLDVPRRMWRPVSAAVGLRLAADLRAGDRAWFITAGRAEHVLVTARRRAGRFVVARPGLAPDEGVEVRATRVLLVPAEPRPGSPR